MRVKKSNKYTSNEYKCIGCKKVGKQKLGFNILSKYMTTICLFCNNSWWVKNDDWWLKDD